MIRELLASLFRPHQPTPPPPDVALTTDAERQEIDQRTHEIQARMERLRLEAERPALRRIYER